MFTEGNQVSLKYFHLKARFICRAAVAPNLIHEFYYKYIRIHFKSWPSRWHDVCLSCAHYFQAHASQASWLLVCCRGNVYNILMG